MKAIGIDIGTTTISAVVLEQSTGEVLESRTIPNGSFIETEQEWERIQDAETVVRKATETLDGLLERHPDISSIGLTGQMHGVVYVDADGRSVSPLYTWQDGRCALPGPDGRTLTERALEKTGVQAASGYGLATHLYQLENGQVPKEAVCLCTIADYLGMVLTGRRRPLVHVSNAASLGFFDVKRGEFRRDALREMGADEAILPDVTDSFERLGAYRGIPVTVALGDNQASFLGSVGMKEHTLLLNMGTGGQISALSGTYFEGPGIEARPLVGGKYLLVGASLCGGRAYAILERFLRGCAVACGGEDRPAYGVLEELARKGLAQTDRMEVRTTFHGTRQDPSLRGAVANISEDNFTPEGLACGVLEGMARELYELYGVMRGGAGVRAVRLVASGNGLRRNPVLRGICARMFGAELTLAPYEEEAACGAAKSSLPAER
ncbi:MAG: FGGY family carbohydrate kinase [Eubacteriales bacterium]|nr:FGGY family carbohydrate kinase [Eubacteriales bacterium]